MNALAAEELDGSQRLLLVQMIVVFRGGAGDFEAALTAIDSAGKSEANLLLAMGNTQVQAERYDLAMTFFQVADAHFYNVPEVLPIVSRFVDDIEVIFEDDPSGLIDLINIGLSYHPTDTDLFGLRAEIYTQLNQIERAERDWIEAEYFAAYPQLVLFRAARSYWESGYERRALTQLEILSYDLQPDGPYEQLLKDGSSALSANAESISQTLLDDLPTFRIRVARLKLEVLEASNQLDDALLAANDLLALVPNDIPATLGKAHILSKLERNDEAQNAFDAAVTQARLEDDGPIGLLSRVTLLGRGLFFAKQNMNDLAIQDFDLAFSAMEPTEITELQNYLKHLGYFDGEIDGIYGELTRRAIALCIHSDSCELE